MHPDLKISQSSRAAWGNPAGRGLLALCLAAALSLALVLPAFGQGSVRTIGGGPVTVGGPYFGFQDGDNSVSQFHTPLGCAVDSAGNLFIADSGNQRVRKLRLSDLRVTTVLLRSGETNFILNNPVAVAFDNTDNLFVADRGDGVIYRIDRFGIASNLVAGLDKPTAVAFDSKTNLYVAELKGVVKKYDAKGVWLDTLPVPGATAATELLGLTVLDNGSVAVSDGGSHIITIYNPLTTNSLVVGIKDTPGLADGPRELAKFNQPQHLAKGPNGTLVVADRANHRVRVVACDGSVSSLYGISSNLWETFPAPGVYPGWFDGPADEEAGSAEAREPVGVAVAGDGTLYATEVFYHIIRQVTGLNYPAAECAGGGTGGTGGGTTNVVATPVLVPNSGYFPMGTTIKIISTNQFSGFGPDTRIYYTTDGQEPTLNSPEVTNKVEGDFAIFWRDSLRDLTALRVKAFSGTNSSVTATGQSTLTNQVGFASDALGGIGTTVILPVMANLKSGNVLRSLQFVVEVARTNNLNAPFAKSPKITNSIQALQMSADDFVPLKIASTNKLDTASEVSDEDTVKLPVAYLATNAVFSVENFATVALVAVPIPSDATVGDRYLLRVTAPSGTSDGIDADVPLVPMAPRTILVTNISYLVGDSSPRGWYNIGSFADPQLREFGDGRLKDSDVNNAVYASFGVRIPFRLTTAFDDMDADPEDVGSTPGGDGKIRFGDWQVILRRSLELDTNALDRIRVRTTGGKIVSSGTNINHAGSALRAAQSLSSAPSGEVWLRPVTLKAQAVENIASPGRARVPIYVSVIPGQDLSGGQIRVVVTPEGETPPVPQAISFEPASGVPTPTPISGFPSNELAMAWYSVSPSNPPFHPPLQGSNLLGHLVVQIPTLVAPGHTYLVHFFPDASSGKSSSGVNLDFETVPARIWVLSAALQPQEIISDEWKIAFFGSTTNAVAQAAIDADGDGFSNLAEYAAGTHPIDPASRLQLIGARFDSADHAAVLSWLSAPGKTYFLERSDSLAHPNWTVVAQDVAGTGHVVELTDANVNTWPQFYRLRIGP